MRERAIEARETFQFTTSMEMWREMLREAPEDADLRKEALSTLEAVIWHRRAKAFRNRSVAAFKQGDPLTALALLLLAIDLEPSNPKAIQFFNMLVVRLGGEPLPEPGMEDLAPEDYVEAGRRALEEGNYNAAADCFEAALDLAPDDPVAQRGLEIALEQLDLEAAEEIEELHEQALAAFEAGDYERAFETWKEALALAPEDEELLEWARRARTALDEAQAKRETEADVVEPVASVSRASEPEVPALEEQPAPAAEEGTMVAAAVEDKPHSSEFDLPEDLDDLSILRTTVSAPVDHNMFDTFELPDNLDELDSMPVISVAERARRRAATRSALSDTTRVTRIDRRAPDLSLSGPDESIEDNREVTRRLNIKDLSPSLLASLGGAGEGAPRGEMEDLPTSPLSAMPSLEIDEGEFGGDATVLSHLPPEPTPPAAAVNLTEVPTDPRPIEPSLEDTVLRPGPLLTGFPESPQPQGAASDAPIDLDDIGLAHEEEVPIIGAEGIELSPADVSTSIHEAPPAGVPLELEEEEQAPGRTVVAPSEGETTAFMPAADLEVASETVVERQPATSGDEPPARPMPSFAEIRSTPPADRPAAPAPSLADLRSSGLAKEPRPAAPRRPTTPAVPRSTAPARSKALVLGGAVLILALVAVVGGIWLYRAQQTARLEEIEQLVEEGKRLLANREFAAAAQRFEGALALDPSQLAAVEGLAEARAESGRADEALRLYDKVLVYQPDNARALYRSAQLLLAADQRQSAIERLRKLVLLPKGREFRYRAYRQLLDLTKEEDPEGAMEYARLAEKERPEDVDLALEIIRLQMRLDLNTAVLESARQLAGRADLPMEKRLELADQLARSKRPAAAKELLLAIGSQAVNELPLPLQAAYHGAWAQVEAAQRNLPRAIEHLEQATQLAPDNLALWMDLGKIAYRHKRLRKAIKAYRKAVEIAPDNGRAHFNLGATLMQAAQLDEAIEHFQRALELDPDNPAVSANLGQAYYLKSARAPFDQRRDLRRKAIEFFNRSLDLKADQPAVVKLRDSLQKLVEDG